MSAAAQGVAVDGRGRAKRTRGRGKRDDCDCRLIFDLSTLVHRLPSAGSGLGRGKRTRLNTGFTNNMSRPLPAPITPVAGSRLAVVLPQAGHAPLPPTSPVLPSTGAEQRTDLVTKPDLSIAPAAFCDDCGQDYVHTPGQLQTVESNRTEEMMLTYEGPNDSGEPYDSSTTPDLETILYSSEGDYPTAPDRGSVPFPNYTSNIDWTAKQTGIEEPPGSQVARAAVNCDSEMPVRLFPTGREVGTPVAQKSLVSVTPDTRTTPTRPPPMQRVGNRPLSMATISSSAGTPVGGLTCLKERPPCSASLSMPVNPAGHIPGTYPTPRPVVPFRGWRLAGLPSAMQLEAIEAETTSSIGQALELPATWNSMGPGSLVSPATNATLVSAFLPYPTAMDPTAIHADSNEEGMEVPSSKQMAFGDAKADTVAVALDEATSFITSPPKPPPKVSFTPQALGGDKQATVRCKASKVRPATLKVPPPPPAAPYGYASFGNATGGPAPGPAVLMSHPSNSPPSDPSAQPTPNTNIQATPTCAAGRRSLGPTGRGPLLIERARRHLGPIMGQLAAGLQQSPVESGMVTPMTAVPPATASAYVLSNSAMLYDNNIQSEPLDLSMKGKVGQALPLDLRKNIAVPKLPSGPRAQGHRGTPTPTVTASRGLHGSSRGLGVSGVQSMGPGPPSGPISQGRLDARAVGAAPASLLRRGSGGQPKPPSVPRTQNYRCAPPVPVGSAPVPAPVGLPSPVVQPYQGDRPFSNVAARVGPMYPAVPPGFEVSPPFGYGLTHVGRF